VTSREPVAGALTPVSRWIAYQRERKFRKKTSSSGL
jgi:hypothetical protein